MESERALFLELHSTRDPLLLFHGEWAMLHRQPRQLEQKGAQVMFITYPIFGVRVPRNRCPHECNFRPP